VILDFIWTSFFATSVFTWGCQRMLGVVPDLGRGTKLAAFATNMQPLELIVGVRWL
jgi:hypothetical protein